MTRDELLPAFSRTLEYYLNPANPADEKPVPHYFNKLEFSDENYLTTKED
jgi:hypothetical protein